MTSEEFCGTRVADFADDDARAESVEEMTAVGVHTKTSRDVTTKTDGRF